MSSHTISRSASIVLITAVLTLLVGAWIGSARISPPGASAQVPPATPQEEAAINRADDLSLAFQRATKIIAPSVVNITAMERDNDAGSDDPDGSDESSDDRSFPDQVNQGSGVIVREDGYIVTNSHVVADAYQIRVTLDNGRQYEAEIIDADAETDLAVIKIDERGLTAARFADSDAIEVGQWVLAVGNPFGLDHTVTAGIVSAKGRPSMGLADFGNFIQTDAAINPGNSGGPLVNLRGEIIGINNAISTRGGGNLGIGFAIPSNMANSVVQSILKTGHVVRGWLGVTFHPLTADLAKSFRYGGESGMLVSSVVVDGPAEAAGLHRGDIVSTLNGKAVGNSDQFRNLVARSVPGTTVDLSVFRLGKHRRVALTLGERPPAEEITGPRFAGPVSQRYRGFRPVSSRFIPHLLAEEITPDLAEALQLPQESGPFVAFINPSSPVAVIGLRDGDVILEFGGARIDNLDDLTEALRNYEPGTRVRVYRDGRTQVVSSD
ncbi:MAG: trypsin-like peptidase domain-containing protein [Planctomycetes bacterium]|nr:trypsin-like peptidase domain-containing protein [Planctomycetota bacterium]